jgi:integrase/recombinase XerD
MGNTDDLLFRFREHLSVLNRSPSTIKAYIMHIERFLESVETVDIKQVSSRIIETWIADLHDFRTDTGSPYSIATLCIKIRSIKRFFEFLEKTNAIFINPSEFIKEPKVPKDKLRETLTPKEIKRLFDQPNLSTLLGIRDRAILETFYATGIRLNELCALTIYDADLQGGLLRINQGKGGKDRVVPLGKHAARFLKEYIQKVRPHFTRKNRNSCHLFVGATGAPVSDQVACRMVRTYARSADIKKKVTPHLFRHTFATDLVRNGADITSVQKMMGHSDPKTTQGYLKSLGLDVKKTHQKTHPRERDKDPVSIEPHIKRKKGRYERK